MITFETHQYGFLKKREVWFYNGEEQQNNSYTVYIFALKKPKGNVHELPVRKSVTLNLKNSEESLLGNIHPTFQYDIQRGKKENLTVHTIINPDQKEIEQLVKSYSSFAIEKKILPLQKQWLSAASAAGNLCVTKIFSPAHGFISHLYLFDHTYTVLTHSFISGKFLDETVRGYANKYLHWLDILLFKERGLQHYDFGGINPALKGITYFKMNFGGMEKEYHQYIATNSILRLAKKFIR